MSELPEETVMRLWRQAGLPEYFLGNAGTNTRLCEFVRVCIKSARTAYPPLALVDAGKDEESSPPSCATCRHVRGTFSDEKCALYHAGAHRMFTWTVRHDERKCGREGKLWESAHTQGTD